MKSSIVVIACILAFSSCGKGDKGDSGSNGSDGLSVIGPAGSSGATGPTGPTGAPAPTATPVSDVQSLVDAENVYREGLGQTALSGGLTCTVQQVSTGQWLSSSSPGYVVAQGVVTAAPGSTQYTYLFQTAFNQPDSNGSSVNNLLPTALQPLFLNLNYKISCSGQVVVTQTGYYNFDMNSDDGSILTVDGAQVINNDGNHGMTDKSGTKYLRQGVHTFSLLYAQSGGGNFGLVLNANGSSILGSVWYH